MNDKQLRTAEEIARLKQLWMESGKSKKQFTDEQGINYMTFIGWFSTKKKKTVAKQPGFVPLKVPHNVITPFAEISFSKGHRVVLHQPVSADFLQSLLK
jgi:hypothetical protein